MQKGDENLELNYTQSLIRYFKISQPTIVLKLSLQHFLFYIEIQVKKLIILLETKEKLHPHQLLQ